MANPLLDAAIKEHSIPKWPYEAAYDRIIVYSLPEAKAARETYVPNGKILMTAQAKSYEENVTPRGVIVSAGLGARDVLKSHAIGLGHVVWVARLSPWRHQVDRTSDGHDIEFLFLRVGDVVGSETLLRQINRGLVTVDCDAQGAHHYVPLGGDGDDEAVPRFDPPSYVA